MLKKLVHALRAYLNTNVRENSSSTEAYYHRIGKTKEINLVTFLVLGIVKKKICNSLACINIKVFMTNGYISNSITKLCSQHSQEIF